MPEYLPYIQTAITLLIVPALGWIVKLEHRITRLETKIEILCNIITKKGD